MKIGRKIGEINYGGSKNGIFDESCEFKEK